MDLSFSVAGRYRGGPAKVAVVSSGLMGMMSGAAAANVATTGVLTIPLMKEVGYKARFAAAAEAVASYGGQIMPPIMGAGAFLLAKIVGVPYTEIALYAIVPAILYYLSVFLQMDIQALKSGIKGLPKNELPSFKKLAKSVHLIIPIIILIAG